MARAEVLNRSLSRGLRILQVINRHRSASMASISQESDIPYHTARRIVRTLIDEGMVEREPDRKHYRPTALVSSLSVGFQLDDILASAAWPILVETTRRVKWPVYICTRVGRQMLVKLSTDTLTTLTFTRCYPGYTTPLLESSSGKAYLAYLSDVERAMVLDSIFDESPLAREARSQIEAELAITRTRGYAAAEYLRYTEEPGRSSGISVPIFNPGEHFVIATMSLIFFASTMKPEQAADEHLADLQDAARQITARI